MVRAASWIAPPHLRKAWLARWISHLQAWEALLDRGEIAGVGYPEMARHLWSGMVEALWLRFSRESLRRALRGPAVVVAAGAAILLATAAGTRLFHGTRTLFEPLPLNADSLVTVRYRGAVDEPAGVPPRTVPLWRAHSKLLADLAGYDLPRAEHARATGNFFAMLGVRPALGRVLQPGDRGVAVLSGAAWRSFFNRSPGVLGSPIELEGVRYRVVGVLPDAFWAVSPGIDAWTPLELEPQPETGTPFLIGALGRLKPGVDKDKVRGELFEIARAAGYFLPRPPEVADFSGVPARPITLCLFAFGFALLIGAAVVVSGGRLPHGGGWRYWSYLLAKLALFPALSWLIWVQTEMAVFGALPLGIPRSLIAVFLLTPAFVLACAFLVWWSFADQRRRCPVCLQLLAMPVTMGSWGSMLEPAMTETLCDSGHGTLYQPESVDGPPDEWTKLDSSWSELFKPKK